MSARGADEVRERIELADAARRRQSGAEAMLSCVRLRREGRVVRVETTVRFGRQRDHEFEHILDASEHSALYRALQIVASEARAEAARLESSVAVTE